MKKFLVHCHKLKKYPIDNFELLNHHLIDHQLNQIPYKELKIVYFEDNLFPQLIPSLIYFESDQEYFIFKIDRYNKIIQFVELCPYLNIHYYLNSNWKNEVIRISSLCPYESEEILFNKRLEYKLKMIN